MAASQMLVVDDDKVQCPNAGFTHIQDAVNAASPGATIRVCQGIYVEQISINKPLAIEADSGAFLMPSAMQQNATSLVDATGLATAILVSDANGVTIRGLRKHDYRGAHLHFEGERFDGQSDSQQPVFRRTPRGEGSHGRKDGCTNLTGAVEIWECKN